MRGWSAVFCGGVIVVAGIGFALVVSGDITGWAHMAFAAVILATNIAAEHFALRREELRAMRDGAKPVYRQPREGLWTGLWRDIRSTLRG